MHTILLLIASLLYLGCAFLRPDRSLLIAVATAVAWSLHGSALASEVMNLSSLRLGFAAILSATLWVSVAAYWLENRNFALDGLRVLILPVAAFATVLPLIFPGNVMPLEGKSVMFPWHVAIAILAYSVLTIAAFHAVLMAFQESRLHRMEVTGSSRFAKLIERLPALLTMEKLLFRLIAFGFFLLTLTVLSGIVFSEQIFGMPLKWDHKTIFTLLSWLLFGVLLAGRKWRGWRGKTALSFTLSGFVTLFLAYVGSRFVLEVLLHRGLT
jgi:ABC-type uncharacterized transport system permease subunit